MPKVRASRPSPDRSLLPATEVIDAAIEKMTRRKDRYASLIERSWTFLNLGTIMYPTPMTIKVKNPSTWKTLWSGKTARANATSAPKRYIIHTEPVIEPMKTRTTAATTKGLLTGLILMSPSDNVGSGYFMVNMMVAIVAIGLSSTIG